MATKQGSGPEEVRAQAQEDLELLAQPGEGRIGCRWERGFPNRTNILGTMKGTFPTVAPYKWKKGWKQIYTPLPTPQPSQLYRIPNFQIAVAVFIVWYVSMPPDLVMVIIIIIFNNMCLLRARHSSKYFTDVNPLNSIEWELFFNPYLIDETLRYGEIK